MLGIHDLPDFIIAGLLLNILPGADSLLIMTRSATQGSRAGCAAALGIGTGTLVHVFAAAIGLSALLATSAMAFTVVKYLGAAYIVYLGASLLLGKGNGNDSARPAQAALPYRKIFLQGFVTNVMNPKVALFFLAFVPLFISAGAANKPLAFIFLGCVFDLNGMLWCNFLAVFTAHASRRIQLNRAVSTSLKRVTGGLFIMIGLKLALSKQT